MSDSLSVLLVEDNPGDARFVEELLTEAATSDDDIFSGDGGNAETVTIHHETTLDAGLGVLKDETLSVDVVLLDLHLPDSEGIETVAAVLATTQRVPVIVLTGMPDAALGVEAVSAGAQDYLVKDDITADRLAYAIKYGIQRHRTEQELRERTHQLEIMNQLTRHDIRNDVSLVVGRLHELREAVDDRHEDLLAEVLAASNHVLQMTRTIGNTVEAVTSERDQSLEPIDIEPVLRSEIDKSRQLYETADISVEGSIPEVEVLADRLLSSVFGNLLSNAMMYNDADHPIVTVDVTADEETVTVAIADNGPGIPPRERELLFSRESSNLEGSGIGIGLYLVASLVELYDGEIWIEDRADWEPSGDDTSGGDRSDDSSGSVFIIELRRA